MRLVLVVVMLLYAALLPVAADEVTDQLDLGRKHYVEGDLSGAINELQFAIQDIRSQLAVRYRAGFPDAPSGWVATDSTEDNSAAMAMFGGGTSVSRSYAQEGGEGVIDATISVDNPMIQGLAAMLSNPAIMSANPAAKRVAIGQENAIVQFEEGGDSGDATIVLGGRMLLQLQGHGLESSAMLEELAAGWKLDELKQIAGM